MRRKILLVLVISILCVIFSGVLCASAEPYGDLTYTVTGNEITITSCAKSATVVNIPDKISGKPVTAIAEDAFSECEILETVTIPGSVKSIGDYAFYYCTSLKSVTIEYGITEIPCSAFERCFSLESITLPESVTVINENAFSHCESLSSITLPESVTKINRDAFLNCLKLESVLIPKNVTNIQSKAFCGCDSLTGIAVDKDNAYYLSVDGVLFDKEKTKLISFPCGKSGNYIIPETVTNIALDAFHRCTKLESVIFTGNIYTVACFMDCTALEKVILPEEVTYIGENAFWGCTSLKEINLPEGVIGIGSRAFSDCESLKSINLPESLTKISLGAFAGCKSLESIIIPDSIERIETEVFSGCSSLKKVSLPEDLSVIGTSSFSGCKSLENIVIPYYANIYSDAFENCTSLKNVFYMLYDPERVSYYDFGSDVKRYYGYWPATGIGIDSDTLDLLVGQTSKLVATITPGNATQKVVWKSDNPSVATVTENGSVEAVTDGTAKIIASTLAGEQVAECQVSVSWGGYPAVIVYNSETGKLTVSATEAGTLYVTTYSGGRLEKVEEYNVTVGTTKDVCTFGTNQKAFVWNKDLEPLCEVFILPRDGSSAGSIKSCGSDTVPFIITELEAIGENTYNIYGYNGRSEATLTNPVKSSPESYEVFAKLAKDESGKGYVVRFGKDKDGNVTLDEKNIIFCSDSTFRETVMSNHITVNHGWKKYGVGCYIKGAASGKTYEMIWGYVNNVEDAYVEILDDADKNESHIYTNNNGALVLKYEKAGNSFNITKLKYSVNSVLDVETIKFGEGNPTEVFVYGINGTTLQIVIIKE